MGTAAVAPTRNGDRTGRGPGTPDPDPDLHGGSDPPEGLEYGPVGHGQLMGPAPPVVRVNGRGECGGGGCRLGHCPLAYQSDRLNGQDGQPECHGHQQCHRGRIWPRSS